MRGALLVAFVFVGGCDGTILAGVSPNTPSAPGGPTAPAGPTQPGPGEPDACAAQAPRATSKPVVRLLEKGDLLGVLRAAGLPSPSLGELFSTRPEAIAVASPFETWQADDATVLLDRTEALAAALVTRLVAEAPACAQAATQAAASPACLDAAVERLSRTLFRRPPTPETAARYRQAITDEAQLRSNAAEGLRFGFELALQSPAFLYRAELGAPSQPGEVALDAWELADALALGLSSEPADATLQQLAASGALLDPEVIRAQARRLVMTPAGQERVWAFYERWLHLKKPAALQKDSTAHPQFSLAAATAAHQETRELVLASLFGPSAGGFQQLLARREGGRTGVLTQKAFLASQAGPIDTRPLHLADVVLKSVVCMTIPPPPAGAVMTPFTPDPARSPRQNFEARTGSGSCAGCHALMNGAGFAFDGYDAIGLPRTQNGGFPIDTTGSLLLGPRKLEFQGADTLVEQLAQTQEARSCHTAWLYRGVRGTAEGAAQACELKAVGRALEGPTGNPVDAIVDLYASRGFTTRVEVTP